jgi:uncharacterized coiled-coil protein SlyX
VSESKTVGLSREVAIDSKLLSYRIADLEREAIRDAQEIKKLNDMIDELRDEIEQLKKGGET